MLIYTLVVLLACGVCLLPVIRRWVRLTSFRSCRSACGSTTPALPTPHSRIGVKGECAWVLLTTVLMFAVRLSVRQAVTPPVESTLAFVDLLLVISICGLLQCRLITIGAIGVQDAGYVVLMSLLGVSAPIAARHVAGGAMLVTRAVCLPGLFFVGEAACGSGLRKKVLPQRIRGRSLRLGPQRFAYITPERCYSPTELSRYAMIFRRCSGSLIPPNCMLVPGTIA